MASSNGITGQSPIQRMWDRYVTLPTTRFVEGIILRRQIERLYFVFGGHIFFQTLRTAVQLDLFTLLAREGPLTRQQIAARLHIDEQPARIVVLGLTVTGLLRKRGAHYSNSHLAGTLFVKDSPYLDSDAVFGVKPELIIDFKKGKDGMTRAKYDFVLMPEKSKRK